MSHPFFSIRRLTLLLFSAFFLFFFFFFVFFVFLFWVGVDDIVQMQYWLMRLLSKMKILLLSSVEVKLFQALIEKVSIHSF